MKWFLRFAVVLLVAVALLPHVTGKKQKHKSKDISKEEEDFATKLAKILDIEYVKEVKKLVKKIKTPDGLKKLEPLMKRLKKHEGKREKMQKDLIKATIEHGEAEDGLADFLTSLNTLWLKDLTCNKNVSTEKPPNID